MSAPTPDPTTAPDQRPASMRRRVDFDTTPEPITAPVTAEDRERIGEARVADVHARCICNRNVYPADFDPDPECPIHGRPPVTAEGLRERVAEALAPWCRVHEITEAPCERCELRLDAVMAALAGDPGDLPARMAEAIREAAHDCDDDCEMSGCHPNVIAVTESNGKIFDVEGTPEALVEVAMSVRWEHATRQAIELERLRAERDELSQTLDATMRNFEDYVEEHRLIEQERDALRAAGKAVIGQRDAAIQRAEGAEAKLAEMKIKRADEWLRVSRARRTLTDALAVWTGKYAYRAERDKTAAEIYSEAIERANEALAALDAHKATDHPTSDSPGICTCDTPIPSHDGPSSPAEDCPQHGDPAVLANIHTGPEGTDGR